MVVSASVQMLVISLFLAPQSKEQLRHGVQIGSRGKLPYQAIKPAAMRRVVTS